MVTSLNPGDDSAKRKEDDTNDTNDSKRNRRFKRWEPSSSRRYPSDIFYWNRDEFSSDDIVRTEINLDIW